MASQHVTRRAGGDRCESVTVVLPTIGRSKLVRSCLESLERCSPRADEILVVDSSVDGAVAEVASAFSSVGARIVRSDEPGLGAAFNVGLGAAAHEVVLLTNDDCVVEPDWVAAGLAKGAEGTIVTGRVRPEGHPDVVPSVIDDPEPKTYSGRTAFVLYTQSMALLRNELLEFGGFDGRIRPSAEDNDLAYRWLRSGRSIVYDPAFIVWHRDWRSANQLDRLYVDYGVGQGMVYGKHLRTGDLGVARFVLRDAYAICRGLADRVVRGRRPHGDWRLGLARGLPVGMLRGLRMRGHNGSGGGS